MTTNIRQGTDATSSLSSETRQRNSHQQKDSSIADKPRKKVRSELFSISESTPYLQIQSVPISQRVDPERNSYILVIQPVGVRAAGGQYTADEAHEIADATHGWDWRLDENRRPKCFPRLEALLNVICKRSAKADEGGEA